MSSFWLPLPRTCGGSHRWSLDHHRSSSTHRVALELRRGCQGRQIKAARSLTKWPTAHRQQPTFATKSAKAAIP
jgi:hypothetical protein